MSGAFSYVRCAPTSGQFTDYVQSTFSDYRAEYESLLHNHDFDELWRCLDLTPALDNDEPLFVKPGSVF